MKELGFNLKKMPFSVQSHSGWPGPNRDLLSGYTHGDTADHCWFTPGLTRLSLALWQARLNKKLRSGIFFLWLLVLTFLGFLSSLYKRGFQSNSPHLGSLFFELSRLLLSFCCWVPKESNLLFPYSSRMIDVSRERWYLCECHVMSRILQQYDPFSFMIVGI